MELFSSVELLGAKMDSNVTNLEDKMHDRFKNEGIQRKRDYENLEDKMRNNFETEGAKMEEGFKNEENARQLVQHEIAVMKEEIKHLKMGSSSTVCSEAS